MDNKESLPVWGAVDYRTSALYITTLHSRIILGLNHSLLEIEATYSLVSDAKWGMYL